MPKLSGHNGQLTGAGAFSIQARENRRTPEQRSGLDETWHFAQRPRGKEETTDQLTVWYVVVRRKERERQGVEAPGFILSVRFKECHDQRSSATDVHAPLSVASDAREKL